MWPHLDDMLDHIRTFLSIIKIRIATSPANDKTWNLRPPICLPWDLKLMTGKAIFRWHWSRLLSTLKDHYIIALSLEYNNFKTIPPYISLKQLSTITHPPSSQKVAIEMLPTDEDMAWFAKKKKVSAPRAVSGQDYLRLTFGQSGGWSFGGCRFL